MPLSRNLSKEPAFTDGHDPHRDNQPVLFKVLADEMEGPDDENQEPEANIDGGLLRDSRAMLE